MMKLSFCHRSLCLLFLGMCWQAGCQPVSESDPAWSDKLDRHVASVPTTVLSTQLGGSDDSPAQRVEVAELQPLTPDAVCRAFLDCLAEGDSRGATQYLTATAVVNVRRAALVWQAPGGPDAQYTLHLPRYANNKEKLATVDCTIRDMIDGEEVVSELGWMLRLDTNGWRICGMVIHADEDGIPDLLSFENPEDIALLREGMGQEDLTAIEPTQDRPQ